MSHWQLKEADTQGQVVTGKERLNDSSTSTILRLLATPTPLRRPPHLAAAPVRSWRGVGSRRCPPSLPTLPHLFHGLFLGAASMTGRASATTGHHADQSRHCRARVARHKRVPRGRRVAPPYKPTNSNTNLGHALATCRCQSARPAPAPPSASSKHCGTGISPHTRGHAGRGRAGLPFRAAPYACRGRYCYDDAAFARVAPGTSADNPAIACPPTAQAVDGVPRP